MDSFSSPTFAMKLGDRSVFKSARTWTWTTSVIDTPLHNFRLPVLNETVPSTPDSGHKFNRSRRRSVSILPCCSCFCAFLFASAHAIVRRKWLPLLHAYFPACPCLWSIVAVLFCFNCNPMRAVAMTSSARRVQHKTIRFAAKHVAGCCVVKMEQLQDVFAVYH